MASHLVLELCIGGSSRVMRPPWLGVGRSAALKRMMTVGVGSAAAKGRCVLRVPCFVGKVEQTPHARARAVGIIARRGQTGWHQTRQLFDGRPRGEGYTHFKSTEGHSIGGSGRKFWYPLIVALPGSLLVYYIFHLDRAPFTNRIRMIDLSCEKELAIGAANYRSLLASHPVLPESHPASKLVQKVGTRIAVAAGLGGLVWEFKVLDSPMVNAACLPGGKVVVFRGLLDLYKYDETALAVVLAHEAGHVVARHAAEQLGFANLLLWAEFAVNIVFNARFITNRLFTLGGRLPYSRKLELEADYIGLMLLAKTCHYDPGAAPGVFETLGRATGNHVEFLATHPTSDRRIQALREALPEARKSAQTLCASSWDHWRVGSKSGAHDVRK